MSTELNKYVKESLKKGVGEKQLRYNLQSAGWSNEDIDAAFKKSTQTSPAILLGIVFLTFTILIGGFFLIFNNLTDIATPINGNTSLSGCDVIQSVDRKISCYEEKVRENYDCMDIEQTTERLFCLRALENHYLRQA